MGIKIKLPDELMNQLKEFDRHTDDIMEKALTAGAKIAEKQAKENLKAVIGSGTKLPSDSTGQLLGTLGTSPAMKNKDGWDVRVGFAEPRKKKSGATTYKHKTKGKGLSEYQYTNAMVANILEYGSAQHNQAPRPFMKPAEDATKKEARAEIKRVFDEEARKYLKTKG